MKRLLLSVVITVFFTFTTKSLSAQERSSIGVDTIKMDSTIHGNLPDDTASSILIPDTVKGSSDQEIIIPSIPSQPMTPRNPTEPMVPNNTPIIPETSNP